MKKRERDPLNIFTNKDIEIIKRELATNVVGNKVVPRSFFFELLNDDLEVDLDECTFKEALSSLIGSEKIAGFQVRRGRSGGIHTKGLFDKHDAKRQEKLKARESKRAKETVTIKVEGQSYIIKNSFSESLRFFTHVLKADTDPNGNVFLGEMRFSIVEVNILENYILDYCNGDRI